ncbi:efflux RND transporter periplasmic adaptor subunit [Roseibacillus persicicus]|uniref:efflux RND transporter periplasmic adaptor subunit n=1 Tax=Roseibacillus persicicus TaxID=454148 RepID=UPI00280D0083|nr:efflux RND transporter periplasmic adaptor subunit [Roseibacillus persicicus]MDQ8190427.1 efflux RND transporter periplasmic adaptor subunit [Roseibacillus persicicus]
MTPEPSAQPQSKNGLGGRILLFLFLAVLLAVGVWIGLRTLQKTKTVGEDQGDGGAPQGPPPSAVDVIPVQLVSSQNTHRVVGSIRAVSRADVAAREEGALTEIFVDEGDTIEKHQILARLDPRRLEAQMAQAQATLTAARSLIAQREAEQARSTTDLKMKRSLFEQSAISQAELLDAERSFKVADSQEKAARDSLTAAAAALKLLDVRKQDLVIRSPFDARVVSRHAELGEWLRAGDPAFTIITSNKVEAWLQVPERFAGMIERGDIEVEAAGQTFTATNLRTVPEANNATRVMTVIADIADPENVLLPGLSVTANLPVTDDSQRLAVPSDALVTTYAGRAIYRANTRENNLPIAEQLPVTFLFQQDGLAFIECEGLEPGDLVVTDGNERLRSGASLMLPPPAQASNESPDAANL